MLPRWALSYRPTISDLTATSYGPLRSQKPYNDTMVETGSAMASIVPVAVTLNRKEAMDRIVSGSSAMS